MLSVYVMCFISDHSFSDLILHISLIWKKVMMVSEYVNQEELLQKVFSHCLCGLKV